MSKKAVTGDSAQGLASDGGGCAANQREGVAGFDKIIGGGGLIVGVLFL